MCVCVRAQWAERRDLKKKKSSEAGDITSLGTNLCEFVNGEKAGDERPENTQTRRMAKRRNN